MILKTNRSTLLGSGTVCLKYMNSLFQVRFLFVCSFTETTRPDVLSDSVLELNENKDESFDGGGGGVGANVENQI